MKLFSIFKGGKAKGGEEKVPETISVVTDTTGSSSLADFSSSRSLKGSKKKRSKKKGKQQQPEAQEKKTSLNCIAADEFMKAMNKYHPNDPDAYLKQVMDCYASEDVDIILEDGEGYKPAMCNQLLHVTFQSFPDFKFTYGEIYQMGGNPNKIAVEGVFATGTHTGAPYTIVPGVLPELEPTGKHCYNDEQRFELDMNDEGKIVRFQVFAMGNCTGFAGFYTRAGGCLAPLLEAKEAAAAAAAQETTAEGEQ